MINSKFNNFTPNSEAHRLLSLVSHRQLNNILPILPFFTEIESSNVNKLLNDFKKFIIQKQKDNKKSKNDKKTNDKKTNDKKTNDKKSKNKLKIKSNEIKQEDIHKMQKLAKELSKKKIIELAKQHPNENAKIVDNTKKNMSNYDLTDTINRIIQMELQNN